MRKTGSQGFTLIELMIVIAIIAIIAAIAIPGLLQSQRASNERNASASLKTLASAQADFRGNDRDNNKVQDFWTDDVSGLYGLCPVAISDPVKLIELSIAGADWNFQGAGAVAVGPVNPIITTFTISAPKAGYWYHAMETDEAGIAYQLDTQGDSTAGNSDRNHSKFAYMAWPDSHSAGRSVFILNENNTIFKRATTATVKAATTPAAGAAKPDATKFVGGTAGEETNWPDDTSLKANWGKLD